MKNRWRHVFIALIVFVPFGAFAQLDLPGSGPTLVVSPRTPAPNTEYSVQLNDASTNTSGATIRWFRDGSEVTNTQNNRTISLEAGTLGSTEEVTAQITTPDGVTTRARATVSPATLSIIVEGNTTVPDWYRGRSVPSIGSAVIITAIPNDGSNTTPDEYIYTWRFNGDVVNAGATIGKFQNRFTMPLGRIATVHVTVTKRDGTLVAERSIGIPPQEPEIHFYELNALRGMSEQSLPANISLLGSEMSITAEPYFMSKNSASFLREWTVDGQTIENPNQNQNVITLQRGPGIGSFNVEFHIRNLQELLQGVKAGFNVRF